MKIEEINLTYVVHSLAAIVLLSTIALFGYELSKPDISTTESSNLVWKMSPLSPQISAQEQIHHLPALEERYKRKVLAYAVRYKTWKPTPEPVQPGKNFAVTRPTSKTYMAMNQAMLEEVSGNQ
jgi:hypothetical protein